MRWWGDFQIPVGAGGRWRIGPMELRIQHVPREWRMVTTLERDADVTEREVPAEVGDLIAREDVVRFGVSTDDTRLRLSPRLADRDVICSPERPLYVPPKAKTRLFVGTPLWLAISHEDGEKLTDQAIQQPRDTWFGPDPRHGELCYASRTYCRLRLEELPLRPHRAYTTVVVSNRASTALRIGRVKLPVPYLALHVNEAGLFWTQTVSFEHDGREQSPLRLHPAPPDHVGTVERVAEARRGGTANLMVRAFGSIFGRRGTMG